MDLVSDMIGIGFMGRDWVFSINELNLQILFCNCKCDPQINVSVSLSGELGRVEFGWGSGFILRREQRWNP